MKYLVLILLNLFFTIAMMMAQNDEQNEQRMKTNGISLNIFGNNATGGFSLNYNLLYKRNEFSIGIAPKHNLDRTVNFGLNIGYSYTHKIQKKIYNIKEGYFHYCFQILPVDVGTGNRNPQTASDAYDVKWRIYNSIAYGLMAYVGKSNRLYVSDYLGFGFVMDTDFHVFWRDPTYVYSLGVGYFFKPKKSKTDEKK